MSSRGLGVGWKRAAAVALMLLVTAGLVRLAMWQGYVRPLRVTGPSMFPTLLGPGWQVSCPDCGYDNRYFGARDAIERFGICANCGTKIALEGAKGACLAMPGERVVMDRAAFWWRLPQRDELIAIEAADGELQVKRVIGLPGERVALRDGELWINGEQVHKRLADLRQRPVLVHDDRYDDPQRASRWQLVKPTDDAKLDSGGVHQVTLRGEAWNAWRYQHRSAYAAGDTEEVRSAPVWDEDACNPASRHRLFPCEDLWVTGSILWRSRGTDPKPSVPQVVAAIWTSGGPEFVELYGATRRLPKGVATDWQVANLDGQRWRNTDEQDERVRFVPSLDREIVESLALDAEHPLAIVVRGAGEWRLENLVVRRDLLLLGPSPNPLDWATAPLAENRYFVLGDNVAVSADSRQSPQGVALSQIRGRVFAYGR